MTNKSNKAASAAQKSTQNLAVPSRPVLKIPLPPSPWGPASSDLSVLVSEALKASPRPRRNQPDYHLSNTTGAPMAPPPTPVEGARSAGSSRSPGTAGTLTPRCSSEGKRVSFVEYWKDDEGGSGRTSGEVER